MIGVYQYGIIVGGYNLHLSSIFLVVAQELLIWEKIQENREKLE